MDTHFEDLAAQIAAGTTTAEAIIAYPCSDLTNQEKTALLTALAEKIVRDGTVRTLASVLSGQVTGDDVVVPQFLSGAITLIDIDGTATVDLLTTHEYVTDSVGDSYPEGGEVVWEPVEGKFYAGRTLTVPAGVTMLYTFVLDA
jgi:hypothetical protein